MPMIGCNCRVCKSPDPHNKRSRSGFYVEAAGLNLIVDMSPEFRMQALSLPIPRVDAVLFTHAHADHVMGFDDIRRFNTMQDCVIPVYGSAETLADVKRIFNYIGRDQPQGTYRPRVEYRDVAGPFNIGQLHIVPVPVEHKPSLTWGFRFDADGCSVGYFPDCHLMPEEAFPLLQGLDVMILDALRHKPHITHLTVQESLDVLKRIGAKRSYLVHMAHDLDHEETQALLPESVFLSYDGLTVEP